MDAVRVLEAHHDRAEPAARDLELADPGLRMQHARPFDQRIERDALAARADARDVALDERLELRPEEHSQARDRGEHDREPDSEPGPAVDLEDGLAQLHGREAIGTS